MTELEKMQILNDFANKLINNQQEMPPEFAKIVNENFWYLFDAEHKKGDE